MISKMDFKRLNSHVSLHYKLCGMQICIGWFNISADSTSWRIGVVFDAFAEHTYLIALNVLLLLSEQCVGLSYIHWSTIKDI